jgi:hypothetical protein
VLRRWRPDGIVLAALSAIGGEAMNLIVILTAMFFALAGIGSVAAQDTKDNTTKDRSGIGGVLDTLGGILGGGTNKLHGSVVLARDNTLVLRTDDHRSVRVDTASIDPQVRQQLVPGQAVTVTARGAGGDVLTASDVQVEQGKNAPQAFSRVTGTVLERSDGRVLFKTKEGLTLPVDTSQIRGLPFLAANTPATLIYEQGPKQELLGVWIEPGDAAVSASPTSDPSASTTSAASPAGQTLEGLVESVGQGALTLQTGDGRHIQVDTNSVDRGALSGVRPGDVVTLTGNAGTDPNRFSATALTKTK